MYKIGFFGLTQKTFQSSKEKVYQESVNSLLKLAKKIDFTLISAPNLIEDKETLIEFLSKLEKDKVNAIIVQTTTFFSGFLGEEISKISLPLIIWALPEPELDNNLKWNSLCALNLLSSIIKKYNPKLKFRWIYSKPESIDDLEKILIALKNVELLRNLKIGHIVGNAPGFVNLEVSSHILKDKFGIEVVNYENISYVLKVSESISKKEINELKEKIKKRCLLNIDESLLEKSISIALAYLKISEKDKISAFASRCWPDYPQTLSLFPCFSFALAGEKIPISCEGDILSSLSMVMLKNLSQKPVVVLDLVYFDNKNMVFWHCGNAPISLAKKEVILDFHFNHPDKGVIVDSRLKEGEVTVFSFNQELKNSIVFSGKAYYPFKTKFRGTFLIIVDLPVEPRRIFEVILEEGFPHHFTIVHGSYEELIKEIMFWLDIPILDFHM